MYLLSKMKTALYLLRINGAKGLLFAFCSQIKNLMGIRSGSFHACKDLFCGKNGIEIGGPSKVFSGKGIFPVYPIAGHLDNCNFGSATVWEGTIKDGQTFQFDRKKPAGRQYIMEATAMECIPSGSYDFVLASHILEHTANPILALSEWQRLLKDQGVFVILLPLKDGNFDRRRPVTTMEHLIADFTCGMGEDDLTHMQEILELHDLERDPAAGSLSDFKARSMRNFENRCLHHHVFDSQLAVRLMDYIGMQIVAVETVQPTHIVVVAQRQVATLKTVVHSTSSFYLSP